MKNIDITIENRSSGSGKVSDELWISWKLLDKGSFEETDDNFILTNHNGEKLIASKTGELIVSKIYNQYLSADLKKFEIYESKDQIGNSFLLYRFKDKERSHEFVLSSVMGVAGGSSLSFKVSSPLNSIKQPSENTFSIKNRIFDFLKSKHKVKSIDLSDLKFTSSSHVRFEKNIETGRVDDCWRGVHIKTNDIIVNSYLVTTFNLDGNHSRWGDNIQMTAKQMRVEQEDSKKIVLRGFGVDPLGNSFEDYGITLFLQNNEVDKIVLHMFDRNAELHYNK